MDIYSLGVVLNGSVSVCVVCMCVSDLVCACAELFGGQRPFANLNQMQIMKKVSVQKQHPEVPAEVPTALAQLLEDCMQYEAKDRPTAGDVLRKLTELRDAATTTQPWVIARDLAKEVTWQTKGDVKFAELDPSKPTQKKQLEMVKALCPGVKVSRVLLIDNKALEDRFAAQYPLLKALCASTHFRPVAAKDAQKQQLEHQLSRRLNDLPGVRGIGVCAVFCFHTFCVLIHLCAQAGRLTAPPRRSRGKCAQAAWSTSRRRTLVCCVFVGRV